MSTSGASHRKKRRVGIRFAGLILLVGGVLALAVVVYAELTAEQKEVRRILHTYFAGETLAEREGAWADLVALGTRDLGLLFWALEAHNATFMLEPGQFDDLLDRVAIATGGPDVVVAASRAVLTREDWVGKRCALMALGKYNAPAGPDVQAVLGDTTAPVFLRTEAALSLGRLGTNEAGGDLALVLRDSSEPDMLRQACAEALAVVDPLTFEQTSSVVLRSPGSSQRLARRVVDRLADLGAAAPLRGALASTNTGSAVRNEAARGLIQIGNAQDLDTLRQLVGEGAGPPGLEETVLEQLASQARDGFDPLILNGLRSPSKKVRMLAIAAAATAGFSRSTIQSELTNGGRSLSAEESQFLSEVVN